MIDCSAEHNFTDDGFEAASFENKKEVFGFTNVCSVLLIP